MNKDIFKDNDSLKLAMDKFFEDRLDLTRMMQERIIWRNILYYVGEQYIEYIKSTNSFRRRIIPDFVPTPVSNEIREYVRSIKASLLNSKFMPRIMPNTNEREDKDASELGENLLIWLDNVNDQEYYDEKEKLCIWIALAGTAFMRTYPNTSAGKWFMSPSGEILNTGDVATETIMPFNMRLDPNGDNLEKKRWIGIQSLKDKEWTEDTFKVKIKAPSRNRAIVDYQKKLMKLVGEVSPWKGHAFDLQSLEPDSEDLVLFREIEFKPSRVNPRGLYAIQCGDDIIFKAKRLLIRDADTKWYYSVTDFHYNQVPGRFWSDPGVNDLISPQNIINEIDQALSVNRRGLGKPKIISPSDVQLKRQSLDGHGFLSLIYNPIMGQKPEISQGTPLPEQVLAERKLQKEQIQDSGGDPKNILRGQPPSAQSSGIQVDILRETAEKGRQPDLDRFKRSETKVYRKRLLVAQEIYTEERIIKIVGRGNKSKAIAFKASDLRGQTDVRLELDSGLVMTNSGKAQIILNMIQAGAFGDLSQNPTLQQEIFERLGMTSFTDEVNLDVERAERENAEVSSGKGVLMTAVVDPNMPPSDDPLGQLKVTNNDPLFRYDNHVIHSEVHRRFIISNEFMEIPVQAAEMMLNHTDMHKKLIDSQPPDMREYVQIDKLYPLLTRNEQIQVLTKMGIDPDKMGVTAGLPDSGDYAKVMAHAKDIGLRANAKDKDRQAKMAEHIMQLYSDQEVAKHAAKSGGNK